MSRCPLCDHEMAMHQCWRLTCPANGGSEKLLAIVDRAKRASAASAQRLMRSSLFDPEPPDKALAFVQIDEEDEY